MGWRDLIFEEEPGSNSAQQSKPPVVDTRQPANTVAATQRPASYMPPVYGGGNADPAFVDRINKVAESAPQRSYSEFKGFLEALASTPLDERNKYIAALATANGKGFPVDEILRGLDVVLKAIDDHVSQFERSIPDQLEKTAGARRREIGDIDQQMAEKQKQIQQLTADMAKLSQDRQTKQNDVGVEERKVTEVKEKVAAAAAAVRSKYSAERQKIASYGGKS